MCLSGISFGLIRIAFKEEEQSMGKESNASVIELSKAFIGCASAIVAACVGGIFTIVAVVVPRLPILTGPTSSPMPPAALVATVTSAPTASVVTATPALSGTQNRTGAFGPIIFSPGVIDPTGNTVPVDPVVRFPEGTAQVFATFTYDGMVKGVPWRWEWYLNGYPQENLTWKGSWLMEERGSTCLTTWKLDGITPGDWELRLYIRDQLIQKGGLLIEKRQVGSPFFDVIRFAEGVKDDKPINLHKLYDPTSAKVDSFKSKTKEVYAFFDVGNMANGLKWRREWYRDGKVLTNMIKSDTWTRATSEKDYWISISNDSGLEAGTYELKLYIDDRLIQVNTFIIDR
jgi:hypothetical protein